jgi:hypothetical protein
VTTITPFEVHLGNELNVERQRFGNEWLFKWYSLNMEGRTVDVPSFDGGRITLGGIRFESQVQSIFWQALGRYLAGKVHEGFQKWDRETKEYPAELRKSSLYGTSSLLGRFAASVTQKAHETDKALRGQGTPKTDESLLGSGTQAEVTVEVHRLLLAHMALIEQSRPKDQAVPKTYSKRLEDFYANNKGLIWFGGVIGSLVVAGVSTLLKG